MSEKTSRLKLKRSAASPEERLALKTALLRRLGEAVDKGDEASARALMKAGADPNGRLYGGQETPLLIRSVIDQNEAMVRALLEGGARPNISDRVKGRRAPRVSARSALRVACESGSEMGARIVIALCEFGADPGRGDARDYNSVPALYALRHNRKAALSAMIFCGYDCRAPIPKLGRSLWEEAGRERLVEAQELMRTALARGERSALDEALEEAEPQTPSRRLRV